MGWSGSLSASSAAGTKITFTPDTSTEGGYTVSSFTAPKDGVYRFDLKGSGGTPGSTETAFEATVTNANLPGGKGGATTGYLQMKKGDKVYVGAGGTCSAAFVAASSGSKLSSVSKSSLYFVAGAGGAGGRTYVGADYSQFGTGGNGGGTSGASGTSNNGTESGGGGGGTQSAGGQSGSAGETAGNPGSYGAGGANSFSETYGCRAWGGRGGDGYYGGAGGGCTTAHYSENGATHSYAYGGGGGSGYYKARSITVLGKTYTSSTTQGGGASSGSRGSVAVTYTSQTLLPVFFDGTQLSKIVFNSTELDSLTYNGTLIYMRRWAACLKSKVAEFVSRAATRGSFLSALRV